MRKIIIVFFLVLVFVFIVIRHGGYSDVKKIDNDVVVENRCVFISYLDYSTILSKDSNTAKKLLDEMVLNIHNSNFNTIILQVRAFADAIYFSDYFPMSSYINKNDYFDVLSYVIDLCNKYSINVIAWINPYRISSDNTTNISIDDFSLISSDSIKVLSDGVYFNPSSSEVLELILNGVMEIVRNYDIYGIIYDDYFYPSDSIDIDNYNKYIIDNENISYDEYKTNVINNLLLETSKRIKGVNKDVLFGISPSGNISNNKTYEYLDIGYILKSNILDFVMPQLYYGFLNGVLPFDRSLQEWESINVNNVSLIPALALYKSGNYDTYAKDGVNEWIDNTNIIFKEVILSRTKKNYKGFAIYRYDNLFNSDNENMELEVKNLLELLK